MKILILGSNGFIGSKVIEALSADHEVVGTVRITRTKDRDVYIDLLKRETIAKALKEIEPEVVINCAGVVDNSEASDANPVFTSNLLEEVLASGLQFKRIIISGSAAEYGVVDEKNIPVNEDAPLNATSGYGLSKLKESALALDFREKHNLPVVVARIFNPIGVGMHPKFIIPGIMRQIVEIKEGRKDVIEVSRLDSKRDYIDVDDIARAIKVLVENTPLQAVYNVGSGKSTSNAELIEMMVKNSRLNSMPTVKETFPEPEPIYAIQADINRIEKEFGWRPQRIIEETIKEVVNAAR